MNIKIYLLTLAILLIVSSIGFASGIEGGLTTKLGYTYIDESDNLSINQQTFNRYEGFNFSLNDINLSLEKGYNLFGQLSNITQNNRNLRLTAARYGAFSLSGFNNQYRRTYSKDGSLFTRRESSGINGSLNITKQFKLFGGWIYEDKDGTAKTYFRPTPDADEFSINYSRYAYNLGASIKADNSYGRFEYKNVIYENDLDFDRDRTSDIYNLNLSGFLPDYKKFRFAGGYYHRNDNIEDYDTEFNTDSYWAAVKLYLQQQWSINYRLLTAESEHNQNNLITDNNYHTISLSKAFKKQGGMRFGYEYRSSDNGLNHTQSDGYLANGWYNHDNRLFIKARYSFISKEVDDGETMLGESDRSRHFISIRYVDKSWGGIKGKIEKRIKKYDDIEIEIDYTSASSEIKLNHRYADLRVSYLYRIGDYTNRTREDNYEFSDHIVSASFTPKRIYQFDLRGNIYYYRSQRDLDLEKFSFGVDLSWEFLADYALEIKYKLNTYDDLLYIDDHYTSNIIEINLINELSF